MESNTQNLSLVQSCWCRQVCVMTEARDRIETADLCTEREFYSSTILITHTHRVLEIKCLQISDTTTAKDSCGLGFKFRSVGGKGFISLYLSPALSQSLCSLFSIHPREREESPRAGCCTLGEALATLAQPPGRRGRRPPCL